MIFFTGFEVWDAVEFNPSWDAAQGAAEELSTSCALLPVTFEVAQKIDSFVPVETTLLVMFGVAVGREKICFERYAHNVKPDDMPLDENGPVARQTNLEIRGLCSDPIESFDTTVSRDCGQFVCNATYYHAIDAGDYEALFVHIPQMSSQEARVVGAEIAKRLRDLIDSPTV